MAVLQASGASSVLQRSIKIPTGPPAVKAVLLTTRRGAHLQPPHQFHPASQLAVQDIIGTLRARATTAVLVQLVVLHVHQERCLPTARRLVLVVATLQLLVVGRRQNVFAMCPQHVFLPLIVPTASTSMEHATIASILLVLISLYR